MAAEHPFGAESLRALIERERARPYRPSAVHVHPWSWLQYVSGRLLAAMTGMDVEDAYEVAVWASYDPDANPRTQYPLALLTDFHSVLSCVAKGGGCLDQ